MNRPTLGIIGGGQLGSLLAGAAKKIGYKMLGAIVTAPEGNVFIKFTGPEKTIDAASKEFNDMINSVRIK